MTCLAKHTDDLWHLAEVKSLDEKHITVQYKKFNLAAALEWESVLLLDNPNDESIDSESDLSEFEYEPETQKPTTSNNIEKEFLNIGNWEKHTKGIGSKLMAKMGYISGKGLGKEGEGRLEPVEVIVLPEGLYKIKTI